MFGIPLETQYDVKFQLLGIPVRIHPLFWAMAAFLGWQGSAIQILIWIACVFVSIMVHEFGHALTTRKAFRIEPHVLLYMMGGLCISEGKQNHLWKRAWVLIMGPGAGFLLFGVVLALGLGVLGVAYIPFYGAFAIHHLPRWFQDFPEGVIVAILSAYSDLLWINLFWGLFNLLPIYPLDGGQLAQVFLTMHNRREGQIRSYAVGLVVAGLVAVYLIYRESYINALFIGSLAMMNLQLYQAARMQQGTYSDHDDDDWWRR